MAHIENNQGIYGILNNKMPQLDKVFSPKFLERLLSEHINELSTSTKFQIGDFYLTIKIDCSLDTVTAIRIEKDDFNMEIYHGGVFSSDPYIAEKLRGKYIDEYLTELSI